MKTVGGWAFSDPKNKSILGGLQGVTQASAVQVDAAILRAKLAASSYCRGVAPGGKWSCPHCDAVPDGKIVKTFKSKSSDTNGFILQSDSLQNFFIVFRGTNSIKSAIVDIKFKKVDYPPVKGSQVHDGFLKSYLEVQSDVILTMQSLMEQYPNYKIDVTGHSLGASQAMLGALDLYQRFESVTPSNLQIFTFGEPRTGNPHFASYMIDTKIPKFRVVNDNDLVPHLPAMSLGFVHSGLEYWIQNDKKTTQICKALFFENKKCSDSTPPFLNFFDHLSYFGITEGLCL
ncbi:catalysis At the Interface: the anatomy of A conformational change in A triglyceride lipase [Gongronella butleri]|nr:catalysis At the Interface: the anatomy of A conformational change in A triglyceride lipase [Gongronella butleri]